MVIPVLLVAALSYSTANISLEADRPERWNLEMTVALMEKNLDSFKKSYNEQHLDNPLKATRVEAETSVLLYPDLRPAVLLDLDGQNGYLLLGEGGEVVAIQPTGDPNWDLVNGQLAYSRLDGFGILNASQRYTPFSTQKTFLDLSALFGSYSGQESNDNGEGRIVDRVSYVADRYGTDFINTDGFDSSDWGFETQSECSLYQKNFSDGSVAYENNCVPYSLYRSLAYLGSLKGVSLPTDSSDYYVGGDSFYASYMAQRNEAGNPLYSIYQRHLPILYQNIRSYFVQYDNYSFGGSHPSAMSGCVSSLAARYGVSLSGALVSGLSFDNDVIPAFAANASPLALIWNPSSGSYANHSMSVTGYQIYSKTSGWWIFTPTDYVNLLQVNDGYSSSARYIDMTAYQASYGNVGSTERLS